MEHDKRTVYQGQGIRSECICGWVGAWHDRTHRGGLPTRDVAAHLQEVRIWGNPETADSVWVWSP